MKILAFLTDPPVVSAILLHLDLPTNLRGMLYQVSGRDPLTLGAVAAGLVAVALLASWAPAWRASRMDPVDALRAEAARPAWPHDRRRRLPTYAGRVGHGHVPGVRHPPARCITRMGTSRPRRDT
jgi:hypothetical protein